MAEVEKLSLQYCKLTKRVEALEAEEDLSSELRKSLADSTAIATLQLTVKTLKAPGEMTTRPIHAASRYAFAGLARWVSKQFRARLQELPHILMSTADFHKAINGMNAKADDFWIKLDIRDFFMSGKTHELVADAVAGMESGQYKSLVEDSL